jgi:hypothetical protein
VGGGFRTTEDFTSGHDGIGVKREGRGGEGRRTSLALKRAQDRAASFCEDDSEI